MAIIEVEGAVKHYDDGRIKALDGVTLHIDEGEFVSVMGPSGSGKSTLLHMLGALDRPDAGRVRVAGEDLAEARDLASFRRREVGFVFQMHNLIPSLTALENVQVPLIEERMPAEERTRRAEEMLALVGLSGRSGNLPPQLSGGERQRVAIARALVNQPRILIADEPTGAVDSRNAGRIMELLERISAERGTTLIVVTHDAGVAARAKRVVRMLDGRILAEDAPASATASEDGKTAAGGS